MIIYGWGNFNRRDHSLVRGTCGSCGRSGYLKSYTSSKFFTLYFIPVIPLGSQKVVRDCPHCSQAVGMSVGKWKKLHKHELPKAVAEYESKPADPEAAKTLLGMCIHGQDRSTLRRFGPQIRAVFARDAEVLGLLAGTYSYLCLDPEADAVYLEAMALSEAEDLAKEADAHLELQKLPKPRPPHRVLQSLPVLIVPAVLLFFLLNFLQDMVSSRIEHGYIINGLDRAYPVLINGKPVRLMPHRVVRTDALEIGRNQIAPVEGASFPQTQEFEVEVSWMQRAFSRSTVVINPDRAAVLIWEKSAYAYPKAPDGDGAFRVFGGRVVHVHADLDYHFEEFPKTVSVSSDGGVVYKTRIADATRYEISRLVGLLANHAGSDDLAGYVRARLGSGDESATMINLGARLLPRDEFRRLAESSIEARPVKIEWHRAYQTLLDGSAETGELIARYRAFAEAAPGDSTLLYLHARALDDPAESVPMFERAATMSPPSGYAANALAYHHLLDGDFAAAARWSGEAIRILPDNVHFRSLRTAALYGQGAFAAVEDEIGDSLTASNQPLAGFYAHLYRLGKMGHSDRVTPEINRFVTHGKAVLDMGEADVPWVSAFLESAAAIGMGDRARFLSCATRMQGEAMELQRALVAGDLDRALKLESENSKGTGIAEQLVLHLLLARAGRADAAAAQLAKAVTMIETAGGDGQRWARWLTGDEAPPVQVAAHACPDIDIHFLYLTVLAQKFPARAAEYLGHAAKIRWLDSFATLALDPVPAN